MSKEFIPYVTLKEITESILSKEERQKLVEKYVNNTYICIKEFNEPYLAGFKFEKGKKYQLIDRDSRFVIIGEVAIPVDVFNTHFKEI